MAESALFQSYRDSEKARLRKKLEDARGRAASEPVAGEDPFPAGTEVPQSQQPAQERGFFEGIADYLMPRDPRPEQEQTGVLASLARGARKVPERFVAGGQSVADVLSTPQPGTDVITNSPKEIGRVVLGLLDMAFPFSAFAGSVGGDLVQWAEKNAPQLTDEMLQARLAEKQKLGMDSSAEQALLAIPYEQRVEQARGAASMVSELVTGFIPGYTAAAGLARAGAKGAATAAGPMRALPAGDTNLTTGRGIRVPSEAQYPGVQGPIGPPPPIPTQRALPPGEPPRPATPPAPTGPAVVDPSVMTLDRLGEQLAKPEHRKTITEITEEAHAAATPAPPKTLQDLMSESGARFTPAEPREFSESGRGLVSVGDEGRAALDQVRRNDAILIEHKATKAADEIVASTEAGGASFSVAEGRLRKLPDEGGFYVAIAPDRTVTITGRPVTKQDITDFAKANADLLADPGAHIGTEKLDDGTVNIDISIRMDDRAEAIKLAQERRQERIFDGSKFESFDVPKEQIPAPRGGHPYPRAVEALTEEDIRVAQMYDAAVTDEAARPAWESLAREIDQDFEEVSKSVRIERVTGQPYASAEEMVRDIRENGVMKVTTDNSEHPFWDVETNFKFRAVHDYRGHVETGHDFSLRGEEQAWKAHDGRISDAAAKEALQVEVYGQAASAQANGGVFPEQKAFLPSKQGQASAPFDPATYASSKGAVYQGRWDAPGVEAHEFKEEALTGGGNFTVLGPLSPESIDSALAEHYKRFNVTPNGKAGDKVIGKADEARARLKQTWEQLRLDLGNESGAIRGEITPKLGAATLNDLVTVGTEILWSGARSFKAWSAQMVAEFGDAIRPHLDRLYEGSKAKIMSLSRKAPDMPDLKHVLKLYHDGLPGLDWYDKAATELRLTFGTNADLYAQVVAAMSPHNTVKGNITMANQAMAMILTGERNADALFKADEFMDAHRLNLNRILRGEPISGPKVGPFYRAIMGDMSAVVVDTWMLRAFGFPPGKGGNIDASEARILFIEQTVKRIATKYGVEPRQAQAAIWTGMKFATEGKDTFLKPLHEVVQMKLAEDDTLLRIMAGQEAEARAAMAEPSFEDFSRAFDEIAGEEGKANLTTVLATARAAVGAAVGASLGENPEDRAYLALLGAGLGSVASAKAARWIAQRVMDPEIRGLLMNEQGAINARQLRAQRRAARQMPNTGRMGTTPGSGAKTLVRDISARLSDIKKLTRDRTVTHAETIAKSEDSRFHDIESILTHPEGEPVNAADGLAIRDTRDAMLEDWLRLAAQAEETGDPALRAKALDQYYLTSKVVEREINISTEGARAQEAHKIPTKPARAGNLDYDELARGMDEIRQGLTGVNVSEDNILQLAREIKDRARVSKLMSDAAKVPSAWWKIYYGLNLLSTPLFHPKNIIGNSSALTLSMGARLVGEVASYPFQAFGVRSFRGKPLIAPGETADLIIGAVESVRDALRAGANTYRTGESLFRSTPKYADRLDLMQARRAIEQPGGSVKILVDAAARLAEKNLRFAGGTDEFYKVLAFTGEQRALARRKAWTSGKRSWSETVAEQARLLNETPKDIINGAEDFAEYNTFTKAFDPDSFWGSLMTKAESAAAHPFMRLTLTPFFRTPIRIAEFATEYTPVLNLIAPKIWGDAMSGGANAQLALSKIAMGTGMTYLLTSYAAAGYITGDWSRDPALRKRQQEGGFKPFSVYIPPLDKYVSYNGLGPLVGPIAAAATYAQMAPHLKDEGVLTMFTAMTIAAMKTNLAQPYFDALNDFVQIFEAFDDEAMVSNGMKFVADRLRTFVPAASLLRSVATFLDGEVKDLKEFGNQFDPEWRDVFNLFAGTAANLPGLSTQVPAYLDILEGEPIPLEGGPFPGLISTPTKDIVRREILELGGAGLPKEVPRHVGGRKAPAGTFRVTAPPEGTVAPLSHMQRRRLTTLLTKEIKIDGMTLHQSLTDMIENDEEYAAASDGKRGGKALMIHDLWNAYLDAAEETLIEEDKDLQEMIRRAGILRGIELAPSADQPELREEMLR